ncbi:flavin reductase [uncultured Alistipes sp.]|jgi:hypothetical protein|uniref:flavin reductase family protein n=1 Tax=uncultured Alistipes sp. TaxID=538949 RepID=UPI0025D7B769|nr:flavin reductase [uncultured Alistipes sp.]
MKLHLLLTALTATLLMGSCINNNNKTTDTAMEQENIELTGNWESAYYKIEAAQLPDNVIELIGKEWMLVTAGQEDSLNTMTASWGGMGYIWERPASFIFIRDTRYTYEFLQKHDGFTLSFFTPDHKGALRTCGSMSGRDGNKIEKAGLTPVKTPSGLMSFTQARMIIECKKMFVQKLDPANLTEPYKSKIVAEAYTGDPATHQLFISEITNIWVKK